MDHVDFLHVPQLLPRIALYRKTIKIIKTTIITVATPYNNFLYYIYLFVFTICDYIYTILVQTDNIYSIMFFLKVT
jgi:hypothetical protein